MNNFTEYSGLSKYYFQHLLRMIVKVGRLKRHGVFVLDFGCGSGELKRLLGSEKVVGYDLIQELSDLSDWREADFNLLVANQVFYSFNREELNLLLCELRRLKPELELVVGISRRGLLNNIGKFLFGRPSAHSAARLSSTEELSILLEYTEIMDKQAVLTLADVFWLRFRN